MYRSSRGQFDPPASDRLGETGIEIRPYTPEYMEPTPSHSTPVVSLVTVMHGMCTVLACVLKHGLAN
jgi:hypothetical protein